MDSVPQTAERRHVGVLTVLSALVLLAFVVLVGWLHATGSRVEDVAEPERALALIVGRTLDFDEGVEQAPAWERRLHQLMLGNRADDLAEAIRWFEELARSSLDPAVDLHLAILEAEAGRFERVRRRVEDWRRRDEPFPTLAGLLAAAYLGGAPAPGMDVRAELRAALQAGWFSDRLAIRLAARAGDDELGETARAALEARGGRLLARLRGFAAVEAGVLVAGAVALVVVARRRRAPAGLGGAVLPPPWRGRTGVVVLLHGGAVAALAIAAFQLLPLLVPARPLTSVMVATLTNLAFVPLLVLAHRRLLAPAGVGFGAGLGLVPSRGAAVPLAAVLLALLAAGQAGEWALGWAARALDLSAHWTEWFDRDLAWGSAPVVAVELVDTVVLTPVIEEILFRGLLFATLRARLGLGASASLSAAIFAVAHGYGAAGFIAVFWSGVLWAVAYEKTGSLLPSIAAHAVDNLGASLALLLVLRA
jgi:membrane protease YdiL (CAAX protease family)